MMIPSARIETCRMMLWIYLSIELTLALSSNISLNFCFLTLWKLRNIIFLVFSNEQMLINIVLKYDRSSTHQTSLHAYKITILWQYFSKQKTHPSSKHSMHSSKLIYAETIAFSFLPIRRIVRITPFVLERSNLINFFCWPNLHFGHLRIHVC